MDTRGGKILEFLRENSHLDLEVPDIAFNVKKSEKTVEAALKKFQQKGLVTARQNEYGRVYWYALPSAPITKTFKLEDLKASKVNTAPADVSDDEEVDLSDLANMSTVEPLPEPVAEKNVFEKKPKKKKPKTKENPSSKKEPELPPAPKTEIVPPPAIEPGEEEFNLEDAADFDTVPPEAPTPASVEPKQMRPTPEPAPKINTPEEETLMPTQSESKASAPILLGIVIFGIISIGSLIKGCGTTDKLNKLEGEIPKDAVQVKALEELKMQQAAKIDELEKKLAAITTRFDSLSTSVDSIAKAATSKKVVNTRSSRRRRR